MYFVNPVDVTVPDHAPGTSATIILRVWDGASFENPATFFGESAQLTISALGGINPQTGAIVPTPDLAGLQWVPEPSTYANGLLGALALLYRRKR